MAQRLAGVGQGQQIVQVDAADRAPANVLGDECGLHAINEPLEASQVLAVELVRGAEREPDAMQAQRVALRDALDDLDLRAAVGEVVLAVRFEPANGCTLDQQFGVVNGPQTDSGLHRKRSAGSCSVNSYELFVRCHLVVRASCGGTWWYGRPDYFGVVDPPTIRSHVPEGSLTHSLPLASFLLWPAHEWPFE